MKRLCFGRHGQKAGLVLLVVLGFPAAAIGTRKEERLKKFGSADKWNGHSGSHQIKNHKQLSENLHQTIEHQKGVEAAKELKKIDERKEIESPEALHKQNQLNLLTAGIHLKASMDGASANTLSVDYIMDTALDAAIEAYQQKSDKDAKTGVNPKSIEKEIRSNPQFIEKARLIMSEYNQVTQGFEQSRDARRGQGNGRHGFRGSATSITIATADKIMNLGTEVLEYAEMKQQPVQQRSFLKWLKH